MIMRKTLVILTGLIIAMILFAGCTGTEEKKATPPKTLNSSEPVPQETTEIEETETKDIPETPEVTETPSESVVVDDKDLSADDLVNKGEQYFLEDKYEAALASFNSAIEKDPSNFYAKLDKAQTLQSLEKYDEARELYEQLSKDYAEEPEVWWGLSKTFQSLGLNDESDKAKISGDEIIQKRLEGK